jgi:uncharacterized membrane protein
MGRVKRWIVAGLLVWVPLGVTFLVVKFLINLTDRTLLLLPEAYQPENLFGFNIPGLGVALTILGVIITGMIFANLFGRRVVRAWEDLLARIPLVRSVYSSVKQITETLFSSSGKSFRQVVMVEYPRRDLWTLAFVTGDTAKMFDELAGQDLVNIYVPTTPNPTSGFFLMAPKTDIIPLDISVEVGLKLILSTGVVVPDQIRDKALADRAKTQQAISSTPAAAAGK